MKLRSAVFYSVTVVLSVVIFFIYSNVIQGEFQFDDEEFINSSLAEISPASYLNKAGLIGVIFGQRLLTILTFALNYHIGGLGVSGYHLFNIILHVFTVILVICFLTSLSTLAPDRRQNPSLSFYPILCIAAIFALHPLQTQAVSYIVQRCEVLASIFYLATLILLLRFTRANGVKCLFWWLASFVFFVAGWISKETIITVPIAYLLCVLYTDNGTYVKRALWGVVPYLAAGVFLASVKLISLKGSTAAGFSSFESGISVYAMTQMKVVLYYFLMFLMPAGQNIDHDVQHVTSLMGLEGMLLLIFWATLLASCLFIMMRYRENNNHHLRGAAFGILWAIVILLPTSSFFPLVDPMFEHRMYLSLLGLSLAAVFLVLFVAERVTPAVRKVFITILLVMLLPGLGYITYQRNRVWLTTESLWLDASQKSPHKSRPFNNLGNCYYLKKRYLLAVSCYKTAISLHPVNVEAYYNLSQTLKKLGRSDEGLTFYRTYLDLTANAGRVSR